MKQKTASSKIYAICIALALLVLLAVNVTFAYFEANKKIQSQNAKMGAVAIEWIDNSANPPWESGYGVSEINVTAVDKTTGNALTSLSRGTEFNLKIGTRTLTKLGLSSAASEVYARFWVDVFISGDETKTNYGQYFELIPIGSGKFTKVTKTYTENSTEQTNVIYFVNNKFVGNNSLLISGMKLLEDAPMELLNSNISVGIHVEAVQANKNAVQSLWGTGAGDWKGYLDSWLS